MIDQVTWEVWLWWWCLMCRNKSQYIGSPLWTSPDTHLFIRWGPIPDSRSKWLTAELHGSSSRDFWKTGSGRNGGPHPRNLLPRVSYDRPTKSPRIQGEYELHRWGDSHPSVLPQKAQFNCAGATVWVCIMICIWHLCCSCISVMELRVGALFHV